MNKIDCPHFNNIGNVCSRVDGMARCDEYSECEFKYIDELKEENTKLKEKLEKIKHIMNVLNNVGYYKDLEKTVLQIIEGAGDK